jgi:hypothetical protein
MTTDNPSSAPPVRSRSNRVGDASHDCGCCCRPILSAPGSGRDGGPWIPRRSSAFVRCNKPGLCRPLRRPTNVRVRCDPADRVPGVSRRRDRNGAAAGVTSFRRSRLGRPLSSIPARPNFVPFCKIARIERFVGYPDAVSEREDITYDPIQLLRIMFSVVGPRQYLEMSRSPCKWPRTFSPL